MYKYKPKHGRLSRWGGCDRSKSTPLNGLAATPNVTAPGIHAPNQRMGYTTLNFHHERIKLTKLCDVSLSTFPGQEVSGPLH